MTNIKPGEILVEMVGGNSCAYFDEKSGAFIQDNINVIKTRQENVYNIDTEIDEEVSVATCTAGTSGQFIGYKASFGNHEVFNMTILAFIMILLK